MEQIEEKYPHLVNCLGNLDMKASDCNHCKWIYECYVISKDLESRDFAPGKYRPGFGRMRLNKKYVEQRY